jgi:LacI family transcriptional regulator
MDVARAAGVSVATVSRSFNLPHTVSDEARTHVLDVARRLGYTPNPAAKALRLQRSGIVGAVFPTMDYGIYARMVSSFQQRMSGFGYLSVLLNVGFDNSNVFEPVRQLVDRGVEALMIVGRIDDPKLMSYLIDKHVPTVCTYSALMNAPFPSIGYDNYVATSKVMAHLLALGHREFALFSGPMLGNDRQQARRKAFLDALERAGIGGAPRVYEDIHGYSLDYAIRSFRAMRENHPEVTAVVCNSDDYGMAVMGEARRMGLRVPQDLSITGFDNNDFAPLQDPPLTTISVAADTMGELAASALFGVLEGGHRVENVVLPSELVVRGSTAAVRRDG